MRHINTKDVLIYLKVKFNWAFWFDFPKSGNPIYPYAGREPQLWRQVRRRSSFATPNPLNYSCISYKKCALK